MSTYSCPVIKVQLEPHPHADTLSLVKIDGYTVAVKTADWQNGQLGAYIPPDYVINSKDPIFDFLGSKRHIKVRRFCQVFSHGLLVPAPEGFKEGDDVMQHWQIERWQEPEPLDIGDSIRFAPDVITYKYDIESIRGKYRQLITEGEDVVITEKLHGCNSRFVFATCSGTNNEPVMWCGSRTRWKNPEPGNSTWSTVLNSYPEISEWCKTNAGLVLYGEIIGHVKYFGYGTKPGQPVFRAFDILRNGGWVSWQESQDLIQGSGIQWVPILHVGPFVLSKAEELALGDSSIEGAHHMREGVVVKPLIERSNTRYGRSILKLVSDRYLSR